MTKASKKIETSVEATETSKVAVVINHNYEELLTKLKSKSAVVRFLDAEKHSRASIAKFCGIRYQHVRNILVTPLKKGAEEATPSSEA